MNVSFWEIVLFSIAFQATLNILCLEEIASGRNVVRQENR